MHYEGQIIRPPSEANSILLQVTVGCSHNKCTFCGTFAGERFTIKKDDMIFEDIDFASKYCRRQNRLFICDGDALIIPQRRLVPILEAIKKKLPWVERVGIYANTKSISMKTDKELEELRSLGLKIAYMGLESGDDVTLEKIRKGADSQRMIDMGRKIRRAGIQLSITVLLGIAGRDRSDIHARETGRVLSAIDPEYVGALSLMLVPGTPASKRSCKGNLPSYFSGRYVDGTWYHVLHHPSYQWFVPCKSCLQLSSHPGTIAKGQGENPGIDCRRFEWKGCVKTGIYEGALIFIGCNNTFANFILV